MRHARFLLTRRKPPETNGARVPRFLEVERFLLTCALGIGDRECLTGPFGFDDLGGVRRIFYFLCFILSDE
jgi:hypothetical protein